MRKLRFYHETRARIVVSATVILLLLFCGGSLVYGASDGGGFRIFALKHISAAQGKKYLAEVGLGTVSQLAGSPSLLVTGEGGDVAKAKAVLDLVDAAQTYSVRMLKLAADAAELPASAAIAEKVGGLSVGTFSNPPKDDGSGMAIVDVHNGSVVVIAQPSRVERIAAAVGQLIEKQTYTAPPAPKPGEGAGDSVKVGKIEPAGSDDANEPSGVAAGPVEPSPIRKPPSIYGPEPKGNANDILRVTLPEKLDIVRLLQLAGEYLDLNFLYDPVKIKGEVTILWTGDRKGSIQIDELYPLLESVLQFQGFAMTRNDAAGIVTVTLVADAIDPAIIETEDDQITEPGHVIVTRIFKLEYIDAASAQNLLAGMKLGTNVSPVGDAKMLFVTGYAYRMPRVERLLKMIDKPGKPKKIRFRACQYTMATALAPKIKTLAEQLGTVSISVGQMSSGAGSASPSSRQPGETTAAYTARLAKERAARSAPTASRSSGASAESGVYLDADERTNRILMIGFDEELDNVEELIDALDVAQTDLRTLKLYRIEHVDAEQVRSKLQELGIVSGGGRSSSSQSSRITGTQRVGAATKAAAAPAAPAAATPASALSTGGASPALVEEPLVIIIEATNSLLINATAEQHTQIALILKYVDAQTETGTIPYVIYPLENQKPEDLATILEKLIQETVKDKEGKIEQVIKKTEEEIVIVPDENTFSIIVYASKKNQEWISNLIKTLDKRRPQVLIDVTLVEVTKNDRFEYDLNVIQSLPDLLDTSGLTGVITEGKSSSDIVAGLSADGARARYIDFQSQSGDFTGFYGDTHVNILLEAMQAKDYGRVLAKPKILVNDNETGTISTTDTTYVRKETSIPVASGGTNESTLVQTAVDFQGYDAGISLDITPHISEGQLLRLEITLTRSDFGNITGDKPPDTTSSDLNTIVTVPDGSTIILGGMIKLNQGKGGTKVPLLGDLPIVGALFRSVSNSDLQKRLYVFVKAEIIRPAETLAQGLPDLEKISQRNRLAFEKFEQEFQGYKSFPGIKSKRIAPIRVLDDE
ncbi:MAG: hypothetical protein JW720_16000 [Sedimentisphaerales bacterium]|nr:hypothetical protein [Sedimentisphaerales bacterium]